MVHLDDAADESRVDHPAEHVRFDADPDGGDVDDGKLPFKEQAEIDLDPFDGSAELRTRDAVNAGHTGGKRQDEIERIIVDIPPFDADFGNLDGQPCRPSNSRAGSRFNTEKYTEPGLGLKAAVTQERKVASFAAEFER